MILLSDGYLANGTEPWLLPDVADLPDISTTFATAPNHTTDDGEEVFWPYLRDPDTLARAWALPGTPDLMHRIGGLEKEDGSGNVSYDSDNHERMVHIRAAKVAGIANDIPEVGGRRPRRRRAPRARLGLHVGRHRRRGEPGPGQGPQGRQGPPHPPQPVPAEPRRGAARATRGCWCPR